VNIFANTVPFFIGFVNHFSENPYVSQNTSMAELVEIQEECKSGMFNQQQTLIRFEHWKERFATGTNKSLKSRMVSYW
jgi:hypothetical protein